MAHAHLILSNGNTTTTDANGSFSFTNLAPGEYNITISRDGYADSTVNATRGMDQNKDLGAVNVDMMPIAATNWWPFILAAMLTGFVGLLLIILVKRRK
jgi:hypothetical protein